MTTLDKTNQDKTRPGKTRGQHIPRHDRIRLHKRCQDTSTQNKTYIIKHKTRPNKTRQDKTR